MTKRLFLLLFIVLGSHIARAYEYPLQFTAPTGARGVTVAGYAIKATTVSGTCNYHLSRSSGGRYGRTIVTPYYNKCTWDLFGNLISSVPLVEALQPPSVLTTSGYEIIYAVAGKSKTGRDTRGFGFVSTPSAHYSWETPNGGYSVIGDTTHIFNVTLISDGDVPLIVDKATVETAISGTTVATAGKAKILTNNCGSSLPLRSTCSVIVSYDPATIACTTSPYGYAYTVLDLSMITNAGANPEFKRGFTVVGVPVCND